MQHSVWDSMNVNLANRTSTRSQGRLALIGPLRFKIAASTIRLSSASQMNLLLEPNRLVVVVDESPLFAAIENGSQKPKGSSRVSLNYS